MAGFCLIYSIFSYANPSSYCDGTRKHPCVVYDNVHNTQEVKNWRDSFMILDVFHGKGSIAGVETLWISGSSIPTTQQWSWIAAHIQDLTQYRVKKMVVVDLREESHGYLNGEPITLLSKNDWGNTGKTHKQSIRAEKQWLKNLSTQATVENVLTDAQFDAGDFHAGKFVSVQSVETEQAEVKKAGFEYYRLTITDHKAPNLEEVKKFIRFVSALPPDTWIHIHCRGGKGRTATFMVLLDMLRNAKEVSFEDIIARQASVPPYYDLSVISTKNPKFVRYYQKRLSVLHWFYERFNRRRDD